jgi:ELWxxDGT repeat protein
MLAGSAAATPIGSDPGLVKQISPRTTASHTLACVSAGGFCYFDAFSAASLGDELWKSDGTEGGTSLVKDSEVPRLDAQWLRRHRHADGGHRGPAWRPRIAYRVTLKAGTTRAFKISVGSALRASGPLRAAAGTTIRAICVLRTANSAGTRITRDGILELRIPLLY